MTLPAFKAVNYFELCGRNFADAMVLHVAESRSSYSVRISKVLQRKIGSEALEFPVSTGSYSPHVFWISLQSRKFFINSFEEDNTFSLRSLPSDA